MFGVGTFASAPFAAEGGAVNAFVDVTGVSASIVIGEIKTGVSVTPVPVTAEALLNSVVAKANADVPVTGVEAANNEVGTTTIYINTPVVVAGVFAVTGLGTVLVSADANVTESGLLASVTAGNVQVSVKASVNLVGVSASAASGTVTTSGDANVTESGLEATASLGVIETTGKATVTLSGVSAAGFLGVEEVFLQKFVSPTGVAATASLGIVAPSADSNVYLTGVSANCDLRAGIVVNVWGLINTAQTPSWTQIPT